MFAHLRNTLIGEADMTTWSGYVTRTTIEKVFVEVEAQDWEEAEALAQKAADSLNDWQEIDCAYGVDVEEE